MLCYDVGVVRCQGNDVLSKPEPMTDKQQNECSYAVEAFGTEAVSLGVMEGEVLWRVRCYGG